MTTHNIRSTSVERGGFDHTGAFNADVVVPKFRQTLRVSGQRDRYLIGQVPAGTMARRVTFGPLHAGPWAYTAKRSTWLSADPAMSMPAQEARDRAAGLLVDADPEDILRLDGIEHRMVIDSRGYIELEVVGEAVPA